MIGGGWKERQPETDRGMKGSVREWESPKKTCRETVTRRERPERERKRQRENEGVASQAEAVGDGSRSQRRKAEGTQREAKRRSLVGALVSFETL